MTRTPGATRRSGATRPSGATPTPGATFTSGAPLTPDAARSPRIDAERLWEDIMALGAITEPNRPCTRRSFSPASADALASGTQVILEAILRVDLEPAAALEPDGAKEGLS